MVWTVARAFRIGTVTLTRPSLTLVRNEDGRWNLEQWLPPGNPPAENSARETGPSQEETTNRLDKIDIDEGRVSFKLGEDKQAFALVEVSGSVQQAAPGRWELQLEAEPWRSGVQLQSTGTIRVQGEVAGTSSRLKPAQLQIHWSDASLADVFRLASGQDTGVRGTFAVDAAAESGMKQAAALPDGEWTFALQARAAQIHRWDLTERSDNPRVNLRLNGRWNPATGNVKADEMLVEAPKSNLRGTALLVSKPKTSFEIHVDSAGIRAEDLLSWYRGFQHGVADGVQAEQYFTGAMTLTGWPLSLEAAAFSSRGGTVTVPGLRTPVRVGPVRGGVEKRAFVLEPVAISFGAASSRESVAGRRSSLSPKQKTATPSLGLTVSLRHDFDSHTGAVSIEGQVPRVEEVLRTATTLGRQLNFGWEMTGEASSSLQWKWGLTGGPFWDGAVDFSNAQLQVAGLNQPLALEDVRLGWKTGKKFAQITKAEGFGATWSGQITHADRLDTQEGIEWNFDLHADHLDAAELDRWVGPRARPGWVQRLLASLLGTAQPSVSASELLRRVNARGVLHADEFNLEKLKFKQVRAEGALQNLHLTLRQANAQWAGGTLSAKMIAQFSPQPVYEFEGQFEHVSLGQIPLAGKLAERFSGTASGSIQLKTEGVGRDALLQKLSGEGKVQLHSVEFRGWDVAGSLASGAPRSGSSRWTAGNGVFHIADKNLELTELSLVAPQETLLMHGNVSFARQADLTLEAASNLRRGGFLAPDRILSIAGPLDGPKVALKGKIAQQPGG